MKVPLQSAPSGGISTYIKIQDHKARQAIRIKEIGAALAADGFVTVDEQARALGLSRSSAWAVLKADHKASGLTVPTINRMLSSPELPPNVRFTIWKYVEEKLDGLYGHNKTQLRRFAAGLVRARAVCRQCSRGYSRLDHRQVGSLVMSYWARPHTSHAARFPAGRF